VRRPSKAAAVTGLGHTRVVEGGERREENGRIDYALAEIGWKDVDKVLPHFIVELKRGYQPVTNYHEGGTRSNEWYQLAPARHDNSSNQATNRGR